MSPTPRQTKQYKKKTIFAPTAGARSSIFPKLCMLVENVVTILKGVNHRNFANLVAPPTNGSAKCLVRYKEHLFP